MRRRFRNISSWILILTMTIGTFPGVMAVSLDQDSEVQSRVEPAPLPGPDQLVDNSNTPASSSENHCLNSFSSETCHSFSLQARATNLISADFGLQKMPSTVYDKIANQYPDLPKRPPKA